MPSDPLPNAMSAFTQMAAEAEADLAVEFREAEERRFLDRKHDGKKPYPSKSEAKRIAKMTTSTFGGRPKMAYRCPVCDAWHVGEDNR